MNKTTASEIVAQDKTWLLPDIAREPSKDLYGYELALYCAGADVLAFEEFGSYQGDWWAHVKLPNGETYFVQGSYGSCSNCDAFDGEFGYPDEDQPDYAHRLRDFGRIYLSHCLTLDQALAEASRNLDWDVDAADMVAWLKARSEVPYMPESDNG